MTLGRDMTGGKAGRKKRDTDQPTTITRRAAETCLTETLNDLKASITAGRPITLPNTIRLCQRRMAAHALSAELQKSTLKRLNDWYRRHQPFRG